MSDSNLEQVRAVGKQLIERIKSDPAFKQQVEKDPVKTLTAAGLPEKAVADVLREADMSDVVAYGADTVSIPTGICLFSCLVASE